MKTTNARRSQWAANALAMAVALPDSADRDTLLQIAKEHLSAIAQEKSSNLTIEEYAVVPSGIW